MKKDINLFASSTIGDKNRGKDLPKGMGRRAKWGVKMSELSYKRKKREWEENENITFEEENNGGVDN